MCLLCALNSQNQVRRLLSSFNPLPRRHCSLSLEMWNWKFKRLTCPRSQNWPTMNGCGSCIEEWIQRTTQQPQRTQYIWHRCISETVRPHRGSDSFAAFLSRHGHISQHTARHCWWSMCFGLKVSIWVLLPLTSLQCAAKRCAPLHLSDQAITCSVVVHW